MIKKILKLFFPNCMKDDEPKRARDKSGKLKADDKKTPNVTEAWVGGKAPTKKRGRPRKVKK